MTLDRRKDNLDYVLEHLAQSNKRASVMTYGIVLAVLAVAGLSFYISVNNLTMELRDQIKLNSQKIERYEKLELELKSLGQALKESSVLSAESINNKKVENVIAKEANRRQINDIEKETLQSYRLSEFSNNARNSYIDDLILSTEKLQEKDFYSALDYAEIAIDKNNRNSVAYTVKAEILYQMKDFEGALSAQTTAINLEEDDLFSNIISNYYNTRGFILLKLKRYSEAIDDFVLGASKANGDERAFIIENVVLAYLLNEEWQKAFDKSGEVMKMKVDGGWNLFLRAISADKINKHAIATSSLNVWKEQTTEAAVENLKDALRDTALDDYTAWLDNI